MTIDITTWQKKLDDLAAEMQQPGVVSDKQKMQALGRAYNEAKIVVDQWQKLDDLQRAIIGHQKDVTEEKDPEMSSLLQHEITTLQEKALKEQSALNEMLSPADPLDKKNIIVEIRAGTGGDESTLFAAELFRLYSRYAERQGWKTHMVGSSRTTLGGFKEVIFEISGNNVYKYLKYESGVHRVQRVPETEKSGRVHTSAVTVAVLPEAEEIDVELKPEELRIDTFMSGGHGGQSVNTTYSAIRITHLPTGMIVTCQDEKSQQQNRLKALTVLRSRLLAAEQDRAQSERAAARKSQVGTGDRSEKIRTYNFPQDRLTDHRIKFTRHNLAEVMDGDLDQLISALRTADTNPNG